MTNIELKAKPIESIAFSMIFIILFSFHLRAEMFDSIQSVKLSASWSSSKKVKIEGSDSIQIQVVKTAFLLDNDLITLKRILGHAKIRNIRPDELLGVCLDGPNNDVYMEVVNSLKDTLILHFSCINYYGECFVYKSKGRKFEIAPGQNIEEIMARYQASFDEKDQTSLYNLFTTIRSNAFKLDSSEIIPQEFNNRK